MKWRLRRTASTLAEVVEPQAIADALARIPDFMIDGTKNPQFEDSDLPPERILAEQFMFLHRQATNNPEQGPVEGSGDSEGASRHTPEMREADEQCASGQ